VISSAGGKNCVHATTHGIVWTDYLFGSVRIELWDRNRLETYFAPSTESDGSFTLTMTSGYALSCNYRERIVSLDNLSVQGESDSPFTITD
jgi:hypothetical protein